MRRLGEEDAIKCMASLYQKEEKVQLASLAFIIKIHDVVTSRPCLIYGLFQSI